MSTSVQRSRHKYRNVLLAGLFAFVLSRVTFALVGFRYRVFTDPFDPGKLAIDLGTWGVFYFLALAVLDRRR